MTLQNPFHKDYQLIKEILLNVKNLINEETDVLLSRYNDVTKFLEDLDKDIEEVGNCDFEALNRVYGEFAPTSIYNEISFSNGWGQEYINLSAQFDKIYEKIAENELRKL